MEKGFKVLKSITWNLKRPDTYIGSVKKDTTDTFVIVDDVNGEPKLVYQKHTYSPGLVKIIGEVIDNAFDHRINSFTKYAKYKKPVTSVEFAICTKDHNMGLVSIYNDGLGITSAEVLINEDTKEYMPLPQAIFTQLQGGSNFDDTGERYVGGRNGVGATLTTIFSKFLVVDTVHSGVKYVQKLARDGDKFKSLNKTITKVQNTSDYTRITFLPDYTYFDNSTVADILPIIRRRAFDFKYHFPSVNVKFNGKEVKFKKYHELLGKDIKTISYTSKVIDSKFPFPKWEFDIFPTDDRNGRTILSFVNGICTTKGGDHVKYLTELVANGFKKHLPKDIYDSSKKDAENPIKLNVIRKGISMVLKTYIPDPAFTSQSKDVLVKNKHMENLELSDGFIKKLLKNGFLEYYKTKVNSEAHRLNKDTQGRKGVSPTGIPGYSKANLAGRSKSKECTLIITEGDSASSSPDAARSALPGGNDLYGVWGIGGKPINPRGNMEMKNLKNKKFTHFRKIMGLDTRVKYTDTSKLRYGKIMIMTDADYDGSHIKNLVINQVATYWPDLLKIKGFISIFRSNCVRVFFPKSTGKEPIGFYTPEHFEQWKVTTGKNLKYTAKYYKGLGTSTTKDFIKYFEDIDKNNVVLTYDGKILGFLETLFGKDADKRKSWILSESERNLNSTFAYENTVMSYTTMVNKEAFLHANYNILRMIPCVSDGLKLGQRKLIATLLKINSTINREKGIKTAVLAGKVTELYNYHHGEASMSDTISRMAQIFVGSNNLNLLECKSSFGNRIHGYKKFSSPRYTYTRLEDICKYLFNPEDEPCLTILEDEDVKVEPKFYIPPVPLIIINGTRASIASGWSSQISPHNPFEVISYIRAILQGKERKPINPYYYGYKGRLYPLYDKKTGKKKTGYIIQGVYRYDAYKRTLYISEIPIGEWHAQYKLWLDKLKSCKAIVDWKDNTKKVKDPRIETEFEYVVELSESYAKKFMYNGDSYIDEENEIDEEEIKLSYDIVKDFRLRKVFSETNMNLLGIDGKIKKYNTIYDIMNDFIKIRIDYYKKRKDSNVFRLEEELKVLSSKYKYVKCIVDNVFEIKRVKKVDLIKSVEKFIKDVYKDPKTPNDPYSYLFRMANISFTHEKLEELSKLYDSKCKDLELVKKTPIKDTWLKELDFIETEYTKIISREM